MDDPIWIRRDVAERIHSDQLAEHGGADGIRDENLFESALSRPRHLFAYTDPTPDIPELAAAYAFAIAKNHAFIDGNKRTAMVVAVMFLELNGYTFSASNEERFNTFLALAAGELSEDAFTDWLKQHVRQVTD